MAPKESWWCLGLAVALTAISLVPLAEAAKIVTPDNGTILISGRIQAGDETRFQALLSRLGRGGPIEIHLDSLGGSLEAAMKIADMVHNAGLTTYVPYRATCASACVLVFAAGANRIAHVVSKIGVHSAGLLSQPGTENNDTLAMTTTFARRMSYYGAPPSVVGKLVTTPTSKMSTVTAAELETWNVKIARDIPGKEFAVPAASPPGFDSVPIPPTVPPAASVAPIRVKTERIKTNPSGRPEPLGPVPTRHFVRP